MNIWNSLFGMIEVQLTSADIQEALDVISKQNITIYSVIVSDQLTAQFTIFQPDLKKLQAVCERKGYLLVPKKKRGMYWSIKRALFRPIALFGILFLTIVFFVLPTRVLFIHVYGVSTVPARRIIAAAENAGLYFGTSRRAIRSEQIKNRILSEIPELQWAGINTLGCTAVISVKERTYEAEKGASNGQVCSIVASADGVISSCTAFRGNMLCQEGQAVTKGQVLISGYIDCGNRIIATQADGEVYAQTNRLMDAVTPAQYNAIIKQRGKIKRFRLLIGKKQIKIWFGSGIRDNSCGRICEEYALKLPGGFQIPISLIVDEYTQYESIPQELSPDKAAEQLLSFSERVLPQIMIAGKLIEKKESIDLEDGRYHLSGRYSCMEMIGSAQWEQDGITYE